MSSLLLLVWSLIAAVSNMNIQAAVEVNKFGEHGYEATDMMELRKIDPLREVALSIQQCSYRRI